MCSPETAAPLSTRGVRVGRTVPCRNIRIIFNPCASARYQRRDVIGVIKAREGNVTLQLFKLFALIIVVMYTLSYYMTLKDLGPYLTPGAMQCQVFFASFSPTR